MTREELISKVKSIKFISWCADFFNANKPSSSMKRLLMLMAGFTLCRGTIILCKAIAHQIYQNMPVDMGTVAALTALTVPVGALAGVAVYLARKEDKQ